MASSECFVIILTFSQKCKQKKKTKTKTKKRGKIIVPLFVGHCGRVWTCNYNVTMCCAGDLFSYFCNGPTNQLANQPYSVVIIRKRTFYFMTLNGPKLPLFRSDFIFKLMFRKWIFLAEKQFTKARNFFHKILRPTRKKNNDDDASNLVRQLI